MTPLHGIACFYDVGFGARAVSRKTPIYFIDIRLNGWRRRRRRRRKKARVRSAPFGSDNQNKEEFQK